ncbi:MAG: PAS domain S-box protein [Candidatus Hydrogenedentes bacterium]|nr:PAS domain S-box protein [Candidatus Hydrogenedentota bacterium]
MAETSRYEGREPQSRMTIVVNLEWSLLTLRYVLYVFMATISVVSEDPSLLRVLVVAGSSALVHNIFSHAVFYKRAYHLFTSPINFGFYLLRICLLIAATGGAASPFMPFLLFLIIAYHIYVPNGKNGIGVTFLVCAGYSFSVLINWIILGMNQEYLVPYINIFCIAFCGWLMNMMSRVIFRLDYDAKYQKKALQSSESTLRAMLDHAAHPILVFDEYSTITDINNSACTFLGAPREKLIGKYFQSYIFDDGSLQDSFSELQESGSLEKEALLIPHDRGERNVEMHIHSFLKEQDRFSVALFHDITEQREFETTSRLAKKKLEEANNELQRVVTLRTEFYANVGNRLRSPLSALLGFTDMLLEEHLGELNDEQRNALHSCRRSIMRIFDLIEEAFTPDDTADTPQEVWQPTDSSDENA